MDVVKKMQEVATDDEDIPRHPIIIRKCGELGPTDVF